MAWPVHPVVFEVNTAVWLAELGRAGGRRASAPLRFDEVDAATWDALARPGVDAIWFMGVWERSPMGTAIVQADPGHQAEWSSLLADLTDDDVVGSPYCVRDYRVDERFGGPAGLAAARAALAERGLRLVLDFVPNHVAPDHPWVGAHPEYFVQGSETELASSPDGFMRTGPSILARGRDPYFPPWVDVLQLDAFSPGLRTAAATTLCDIAAQCDGIRCDMAMLMLDDVFARTWGARVGSPLPSPYWTDLIGVLRDRHPGTLLVAEAYWDLEPRLIELGFDACYDKRLYDRLVYEDAPSVRAHLSADPDYQRHMVRFLENHDEPRAAAVLPRARQRAATVAMATLPGVSLWHDGQLEGRRVRVPVFLGRRPDDKHDPELLAFSEGVLALEVRRGDWQLCPVEGWPDNRTCEHLLAWTWTDAEGRYLVVVDFADAPAQARVRLPWDDLAGRDWLLTDLYGGQVYRRPGDGLVRDGLYVERPGWGFHVMRVEAVVPKQRQEDDGATPGG